ncbi:MAG: polysaccharide deacetylase family protein [Bacilli bacterium]|nr:polysaccharide deacetylase family protein [Bacilli bacterium]
MEKRKLVMGVKIGGVVLLVFGIFYIAFYDFFKKYSMEEVNEIKETPLYVLKIDYPVVENKNVKKEIEEYIENVKKDFIVDVEALNGTDMQYDLMINYEMEEYEKVKSIHIIVYAFTGGNHYVREDKIFRYNVETGEKVYLTYFLEDTTRFPKLRELTRKYIEKYYIEHDGNMDKEWVEKGTDELINYDIFRFVDEGLEITFVPYQIGPWSDGEVKIVIPNEELSGIIKKEFLHLKETEKPVFAEKMTRDLSQFAGKKLLAFTFDDGPGGSSTRKLLDNLDLYNARVTFFVLGSRVNNFSENLKRAYEMGNTIGSHTYNHFNLYKLSLEKQMQEINDTNTAIESVIGQKPIYLRPPYGNIKNEAKEQSGMFTILWNIDTEDWKKKNAEKIADHIVSHAHDGAIILLHDIYSYSVDGALLAMEALKDEYAFVTIDEMLQLKGKTLEPLKSYYGF